jgi:hypothetical protein
MSSSKPRFAPKIAAFAQLKILFETIETFFALAKSANAESAFLSTAD